MFKIPTDATMPPPETDGDMRKRRAKDRAIGVEHLFEEIKALGYTGCLNLLSKYISQGCADANAATSPHVGSPGCSSPGSTTSSPNNEIF